MCLVEKKAFKPIPLPTYLCRTRARHCFPPTGTSLRARNFRWRNQSIGEDAIFRPGHCQCRTERSKTRSESPSNSSRSPILYRKNRPQPDASSWVVTICVDPQVVKQHGSDLFIRFLAFITNGIQDFPSNNRLIMCFFWQQEIPERPSTALCEAQIESEVSCTHSDVSP